MEALQGSEMNAEYMYQVTVRTMIEEDGKSSGKCRGWYAGLVRINI